MSTKAGTLDPLGSGAFVSREGLAAVIDLTPADRLVIARLQDVEDHPDLVLDEAA